MTLPAQTFHVLTYGCQMNDADSDHVVGMFEAQGLEQAPTPEEADLVLVNTCCVRGGAEERSLARIESLRPWRESDNGHRLVLMGCTAQKEGDSLLQRLPHVDLVVGTRDLSNLDALIQESYQGEDRRVAVECIDTPEVPLLGAFLPRGRVRALVNIMVGCNNKCSFCIVPKTRGTEVSRPADEIVAEIESLVAQGCREVMLLGQNVNSYRSPEDEMRFPELLRRVDAIPGLLRTRFVTSHPKDMSPALADAMRFFPTVCESIHLPVQSGSTPVLNRMRRTYNREQYLKLIDRIRTAVPTPQSAITTDIIVGFPGETEDDFEQTLSMLELVRWDSAFIFMYSPREGTHAAETMDDDVPLDVKKRRLQTLLARQEEISAEINRSLVGSEQEVLFENTSRRSTEDLVGRTRTDKHVIVRAPRDLIGTAQRVKITEGYAHTLFGELVEQTAAVG